MEVVNGSMFSAFFGKKMRFGQDKDSASGKNREEGITHFSIFKFDVTCSDEIIG